MSNAENGEPSVAEPKRLVEKKTSYHHGDLRLQLLEAVRQLVEDHGPDGFSIAEACRRAGVSTAAPYKHFRDRGEIMRGVVQLGMARLRGAMQEAADAHPPGSPERIVALGRSYIAFARSEPGVFRMVFGLTEGHEADAELTRQGEETLGIVEGVVGDFLGIDPASPEARLRAYALWCLVHGHGFLVIDDKLSEKGPAIDETAFLTLVGTAMLSRR